MPKISKRIIDTLKPDPAKEVFTWDTELRGFGVRMMPTGIASYLVKYRNAEGRQRKIVIARVGTLTPEQARQIAREKIGEISKGADPSAERQQLRRAVTIAELCNLYLEDADGRVKASTLAMDRSRIERHVKPLIGRRTVQGLTPTDVAKMQTDIINGKTARNRAGRGGSTTGGKGVAGRTVGMLGTILEFARRRRIITENVARGIKRPPERKQKRFLSTDEIRQFGETMRRMLDEAESATGIAAIRFLLLSGCRRMEALSLPVVWLDRANGCIRFGDTKTGAQIRPIGASAFKVIDAIEHRHGWVFPAGKGDGHFIGLPNVLERVCERAKLEGVTIHVLRHSFAATAAEMGYSELTIAGLLGHSLSSITARYAHVADKALVSAANAVSARIADLLDGRETTGTVIPLPGRA